MQKNAKKNYRKLMIWLDKGIIYLMYEINGTWKIHEAFLDDYV